MPEREEEGLYLLSHRPSLRTALSATSEYIERYARLSVEQRVEREEGTHITALSDLAAYYRIAADTPDEVHLRQAVDDASSKLLLKISVFENRAVAFGLRRKGMSTGIDVYTVKLRDEEEGEYERGLAFDKTWERVRRGQKKEPRMTVSSLTFKKSEVVRDYLGGADLPISHYDALRGHVQRISRQIGRMPVPAGKEFSYTVIPTVFYVN